MKNTILAVIALTLAGTLSAAQADPAEPSVPKDFTVTVLRSQSTRSSLGATEMAQVMNAYKRKFQGKTEYQGIKGTYWTGPLTSEAQSVERFKDQIGTGAGNFVTGFFSALLIGNIPQSKSTPTTVYWRYAMNVYFTPSEGELPKH